MSNAEVKVLENVVEIDYKWNPGPVVGRFLTDLRDKAEVTGIRCTKTSKVFLPPQSWSPYGQIKMDRFVTITAQPHFEAGTIVHQAPWNLPDGLKPPYMLASISFAGADTGLLHLIQASETELRELQPGRPLRIVWAPERNGTIRDILYFEPA